MQKFTPTTCPMKGFNSCPITFYAYTLQVKLAVESIYCKIFMTFAISTQKMFIAVVAYFNACRGNFAFSIFVWKKLLKVNRQRLY